MNALTAKVVAAKEALTLAIGDDWLQYLTNMKLWFGNKWSKEEFDYECRKLLTPEKLHLHNQFLLAVLNKVDAFTASPNPSIIQDSITLTSTQQHQANTQSNSRSSSCFINNSSRKRKRSSRSYFERVTFEPYDISEYLFEDSMQLIHPPTISEQNQNLPIHRYCVQELFLPDAGFVMARYLIGAWESGLLTVDDEVAEYVAHAVQVFLKNLISTLILKRRDFKATSDGNYYYDIGATAHDPSLRNTVTRQKVDDGPLELDKEITSANFMRRSNDDNAFLSACEQIESNSQILITLKDCQRVFRDRNLIPSHSLYAINMERINMMMN